MQVWPGDGLVELNVMLRKLLWTALYGATGALATIVSRSLPFTDAIKKRSDVCLVEVYLENRKQLLEEISDRFKTSRGSRHGI